jgi:hypothetical protein
MGTKNKPEVTLWILRCKYFLTNNNKNFQNILSIGDFIICMI